MPRKNRICFPGECYHVIVRGNNRAAIFFSDEERVYFLSILEQAVKRFDLIIHAYCLMSNHVHLAIQLGKESISKIMHNINFRYARWLNKRQNRIGHVYQGRFKSIHVGTKSYLLELVRYIHLNPVRAKMVTLPEEYRWSSHSIYCQKQQSTWVSYNIILSFLDINLDRALEKFHMLMQTHTLPEVETILLNDTNSIFDDFLNNSDENNIITSRVSCTFHEIVTFICSRYIMDVNSLKLVSRNSRDRKASAVRAIITWLARELDTASLTYCANYFNRDPSGLLRTINRIERCGYDDETLATIKLSFIDYLLKD